MALSVGQDTGYKKGVGTASLGQSGQASYMKKLQEQMRQQQIALAAANAAALRARNSRESAAAYRRSSRPSYLERYANPLNDKGQTPAMASAMGNYSNWYESGAENLAPILDPNNVYQGKLRPEYGKRDKFALAGYEYGDNDSGRDQDPGKYKDYHNLDLLPDNYFPVRTPEILPPDPTLPGGGDYAYPDYQWEYPNYGGSYPVYSSGGSTPSRINEWYQNMVQWNINRPKGS